MDVDFTVIAGRDELVSCCTVMLMRYSLVPVLLLLVQDEDCFIEKNSNTESFIYFSLEIMYAPLLCQFKMPNIHPLNKKLITAVGSSYSTGKLRLPAGLLVKSLMEANN